MWVNFFISVKDVVYLIALLIAYRWHPSKFNKDITKPWEQTAAHLAALAGQETKVNVKEGSTAQNTNAAKPIKVAIIGASGTYGKGILARAEEIGVKAAVVTRSPHKFKNVKPTTTVIETQLDEEEKLREAFAGCDGVISALGDDRKERPKTHNLPHVWNAMKAAGVTKYIGMGSGAMMMPGEKRGRFQLAVQPLLIMLKGFGVDLLEQNEWERDSLLMGENGADGITWVVTRPVRPTTAPFVGAYAHKDKRGPMNCSIYDHGDFCLYCVASSQWDRLAPHVSSGPPPREK